MFIDKIKEIEDRINLLEIELDDNKEWIDNHKKDCFGSKIRKNSILDIEEEIRNLTIAKLKLLGR